MAEPTLYFTDFRTSFSMNMEKKLRRLLDKAGLARAIKKDGNVAIKVHFGEPGNTAFVSPLYIRCIVEMVRAEGGVPFLVDTNTLYKGGRTTTPQHLLSAERNGFTPAVTGAAVLIGGGLFSKEGVMVKIQGKHREEVAIVREITDADSLIVVSHAKGHIGIGYGGAIKNLGMGCTTREGKLDMHSVSSPFIKREVCNGCSLCIEHCPGEAIRLVRKKAVIDESLCTGCAQCVGVCPVKGVDIRWNRSENTLQEMMVEYCCGAMKGKGQNLFFINFVNNVTPTCDCHPNSDLPIVPDIGILASTDPVAIDSGSVNLINSSPGSRGSSLHHAYLAGEDKFRDLYPEIDYRVQFKYGEEMGAGKMSYKLIVVG